MFEFNIDDHARIAELINNRKEDAFVMPLYLKVYNTIYDIRDIKEIKSFSPSGFKIGFGACNSLFSKNNFPTQYIYNFGNVNVFTEYNEKYNSDNRYIVFESSSIDDESKLAEHPIFEQINYYYELFKNYLLEISDSYRKEIIEEKLNNQ